MLLSNLALCSVGSMSCCDGNIVSVLTDSAAGIEDERCEKEKQHKEGDPLDFITTWGPSEGLELHKLPWDALAILTGGFELQLLGVLAGPQCPKAN